MKSKTWLRYCFEKKWNILSMSLIYFLKKIDMSSHVLKNWRNLIKWINIIKTKIICKICWIDIEEFLKGHGKNIISHIERLLYIKKKY